MSIDSVPVLCLHSSMSSAKQWAGLSAALPQRQLVCPDLSGYGGTALPTVSPWSLRAEAAFALEQLPAAVKSAPVDIVGHSYGGAVAMHLVRTGQLQCRRMVLFEPVAFHLLRLGADVDKTAAALWQQVSDFSHQLYQGDNAAALFLDHWQGAGFFASLPPRVQRAMAAQVAKVADDFQALADEPATLDSYRQQLSMPVLLLSGRHSRPSALYLAELLAAALPDIEHRVVDAGHMAPVTHPQLVFPLISAFLQL